jgi:competence protein ComGC
MTFSSGLATVFPGTAVVESEFSVLKYEKNSFRTSLLDLTLEGIMHSKQYDALF